MTKEQFEAMGYKNVRQLPAGNPYAGMWIGLRRMIYTVGLCVGLDETGYLTRFCFEDWDEALASITAWDGHGWPPGYWIKAKSQLHPDVPNPARNPDAVRR